MVYADGQLFVKMNGKGDLIMMLEKLLEEIRMGGSV